MGEALNINAIQRLNSQIIYNGPLLGVYKELNKACPFDMFINRPIEAIKHFIVNKIEYSSNNDGYCVFYAVYPCNHQGPEFKLILSPYDYTHFIDAHNVDIRLKYEDIPSVKLYLK